MQKFKGKALYQPSGKAAEYSPWAVNFYTGCSNDCEYCYCKRGVMSHVWSTTPKLKKCFRNEEHAVRTLFKEVEKNIDELRKKGVLFSFTTDPMLPETRTMTMGCLEGLLRYNIPVKLLTKKADWVWEFQGRLMDYPLHRFRDNIAFGFTLTGHDDQEPNASTNEERIKAMKELHQLGYRTWASIEPVISVGKSIRMIDETFEFCDLYKVGLMSGVKASYYDEHDLYRLRCYLSTLSTEGIKIYPKDSLLERTGFERESLNDAWDADFVSTDYNIFKDSNNETPN